MPPRAQHASPPGDAQARAYLKLLASSEPLTTPPRSAPSGPLRPLKQASPAHRAATHRAESVLPGKRGRRAMTATLLGKHGRRAMTATLLGKHGRRAMTATLVAGISVAGVSAAAASTSQIHAAAPLSHPERATPSPTIAADRAGIAPIATDRADTAPIAAGRADIASIAAGRAGIASIAAIEPPPKSKPKLSGVLVRRKPRPVVVPATQWVNPLPEAAVTSCFGERWGRLHAGVDLAAPNGTRIRAAGAGVVVAAGVAQGYGNAVLIDHGNGYLTHYGHMSVIAVLPGQQVVAGQEIGLEGSTGNSTGPHLHFEVHQGTYQNPIEPTGWLREHGVAIPGCAPLAVPAEANP